MATYRITAEAEGSASVTVTAANEMEAETTAFRDHLTGIIIDGGESGWRITSIEEVTSE